MSFRSTQPAAILFQLFWCFFRIGPTTFGGGYAMLPGIEREVVQKRSWVEPGDWGAVVSLAGSAPGGIGINAAAMVGYRKAGIAGAIAAVAGITCPTLLIALLISAFAALFQENAKVQAALRGMHGGITALILMAGYRMARLAIIDVTTAIFFGAALIMLFLGGIHPLYIVVLGLAGGLGAVQIKAWLGLPARTEKKSASGQAEPEYYI